MYSNYLGTYVVGMDVLNVYAGLYCVCRVYVFQPTSIIHIM